MAALEAQYMVNNCEYYTDYYSGTAYLPADAPCRIDRTNDDLGVGPPVVCPSRWRVRSDSAPGTERWYLGLDLSEHLLNACSYTGYFEVGGGPGGDCRDWLAQVGTTYEVWVPRGFAYQDWAEHVFWPPPRENPSHALYDPRVIEGSRLGTCPLVDRDNPGEPGHGTCDVQELLDATNSADWMWSTDRTTVRIDRWPFWCYSFYGEPDPTEPLFFGLPTVGTWWESAAPEYMFLLLYYGWVLDAAGAGHEYTVLGYDDRDHDNEPSPGDGFVVRNSWGEEGPLYVDYGWLDIGENPVFYVHGPIYTYMGCDDARITTWRDADDDGDGLANGQDVCLYSPNTTPTPGSRRVDPVWQYADADGWPDAVTVAGGGDWSGCDNCPGIPAAERFDQFDQDGIGTPCDACPLVSALTDPSACGGAAAAPVVFTTTNDADWDWDGDGVPEGDGFFACCDPCPYHPERSNDDEDRDGVFNHCDPCPEGDRSGADNCDVDHDGFPDDATCTCPSGWACPAGALDNCPGTPNPVFVWPPCAQGESDTDGIGDLCDNCPFVDNPTQMDGDGDTAADACDNCPVVPNPHQDDLDLKADGSWEADGTGESCDNCPGVWNHSQADDDLAPDGGGGFIVAPDGVGNVCDNCRVYPNPDQHNCNVADEQAADALWGRPSHLGLGDACDWSPCVDTCMRTVEADHDPGLDPTIDTPHSTYWGGSIVGREADTEPITARFCTVGGENWFSPATRQPPPRDFPTKVAGCWCDPRTDTTAECESNPSKCPGQGLGGGRWQDVWYPDRCVGGVCAAFPTFPYEPLYSADPTLALRGTPYETRENYVPYYADPTRRRTQDWSWIWQFGYGPHNLRMWFKPQAAGWFTGYLPESGNTYTDPWRHVDGTKKPIGSPGAGGLATAGQALLPHGQQRGWGGPFESPMQWFADIIWEWLCRISDCDPRWPDWFFFEPRGPRVGGIILASWDDQRKSYRNITATKLAKGQLFDVVAPTIAFAYDKAGMANRYWLFGGLDSANLPSDQMWGARRASLGGGSVTTYADGDAASNLPPSGSDGVLAGPNVFFELAQIPHLASWPPGRSNAVLLCTGFGLREGQACDTVCPKVDAALALADGGIGTDDSGALLLVGGDGMVGLLDDIWLFSTGTLGSPRGWRLAGRLPGVAEGLAGASFVQVGRTVWLVGGRTGSGASNDVWRIAAETGLAERAEVSGPRPAGRISPAVTYDAVANRILVFGGVDVAGVGHPDLWSFATDALEWKELAATCTGQACPAATAREALHFDVATGELTVVADRGGPDAAKVAWTLREGMWLSRLELLAEPSTVDCNSDDEPELLAGLRCGLESGGYPDYGRMACEESELTCRAPTTPAQVVAEYEVGGLRTIVAEGHELYLLKGAAVDVYRLDAAGGLVGLRSLHLSRAAHDVALFRDYLLAADGRGLTVYGSQDGAEVAHIDTCGKARRVFSFAAGAVVLGLRSVLIVDLNDPTRPVVTADMRLWPTLDGLTVTADGGCPRTVAAVERLWDAVGPAAASGRDVGAFADGRLFVNLLGSTYALDFSDGSTPVVSAGVPTGLMRDMRVEDRFVYANTAWGDGIVLGEVGPGEWEEVGPHAVQRWVEGTVESGAFSLAWGRGRLTVAGRE
ncbi:MAG: hypothetical protein HY905_14865 [Deltaproteobacteria bacterium]|nr:hypothetical protein [Deltaproteobacteria bacterium]